jgi:hypothetical protein
MQIHVDVLKSAAQAIRLEHASELWMDPRTGSTQTCLRCSSADYTSPSDSRAENFESEENGRASLAHFPKASFLP